MQSKEVSRWFLQEKSEEGLVKQCATCGDWISDACATEVLSQSFCLSCAEDCAAQAEADERARDAEACCASGCRECITDVRF